MSFFGWTFCKRALKEKSLQQSRDYSKMVRTVTGKISNLYTSKKIKMQKQYRLKIFEKYIIFENYKGVAQKNEHATPILSCRWKWEWQAQFLIRMLNIFKTNVSSSNGFTFLKVRGPILQATAWSNVRVVNISF